MMARPLQFSLSLALLCLCIFAIPSLAETSKSGSTSTSESTLDLSIADVDAKLQDCAFVKQLNHDRAAAAPETSSLMKRVYAIMFPGTPAVNSLLGTAYISGPPNFLLALTPANLDPASLSVMVAFAVGGLMGDTLLHLIPQVFLGEPNDERAHFVLSDTKRNEVLAMFIFVGFLTFLVMDKTLRIITGGEDPHGHSHSHAHAEPPSTAVSSGVNSIPDDLKNRKAKPSPAAPGIGAPTLSPTQTVKPSSILNLVSDFTHNITDGLAMSGAFYASPLVGATTCTAVMLHEIPHEVGDAALLIQSGFTKWQAMAAQFFTASGAFLGTCIGIAIQEYAKGGEEKGLKYGEGVLGTDLGAGDLVLPWTAGTFLYVGFSAIPELLETGGNRRKEVRKALVQGVAMISGFALMFMLSE